VSGLVHIDGTGRIYVNQYMGGDTVYLVTNQEMRQIESYVMNELRVPGILLMEQAGRELAKVITTFATTQNDRARCVRHPPKVCVVAGKGNNGGDGLIAARHLHAQGISVRVIALSSPAKWKGDARQAYDMAMAYGVELSLYTDEPTVAATCAEADIVVDAILGTGARSILSESVASAVRCINRSGRPIIAVDVPTGVNGDTGDVAVDCVCATVTVTFGLAKRGLYQYPAAEAAGKVIVADIGVPMAAIEHERPLTRLSSVEQLRQRFVARPQNSHKGTFGHVCIIGGAYRTAGAALLAGIGAYRTGCGLVTLALPKSVLTHLLGKEPELLLQEVPDNGTGEWSDSTAEPLRSVVTGKTVVVGPGLGRFANDHAWLCAVLQQSPKAVVLDADALNMLASDVTALTCARGPVILTPHPKEFARLVRRSVSEVQADRLTMATCFAVEHQVVLILKGAYTVIALPTGRLWINPTGNSGMATGGSGDVLAGIVGSLCAQGFSAEDAAITGVYLHGLAGDYAAKDVGEHAMMATDIVERLPKALQSI